MGILNIIGLMFSGLPGVKCESEGCCNISGTFYVFVFNCTHFFFILSSGYLIIVFNQIDQEREGEQIDRALLKNVLDIFVEIGMSQMDYYENDFEEAMLKDTAAYYSRKASNWILEDSCPDYMLKVHIYIFVILKIFLIIDDY